MLTDPNAQLTTAPKTTTAPRGSISSPPPTSDDGLTRIATPAKPSSRPINSPDRGRCPFGLALREDLLAIDSITPSAATIRAPWLLVHGTQDEVVPLQHSHDLHAAANTSELVVLENVDHSFTGTGLDHLTEAVVPWLLRHLEPA